MFPPRPREPKLLDHQLTDCLQVRFGQIKRKYGLDGDSPSKKTGKGAQVGDLPATPTKVTKSRKAPGSGGRGRKVKKEEPEEDNEDEVPRPAQEKSKTPPSPTVKGEADWIDVKSEEPSDNFLYF